jgi:hypothetical protein
MTFSLLLFLRGFGKLKCSFSLAAPPFAPGKMRAAAALERTIGDGNTSTSISYLILPRWASFLFWNLFASYQ